jgi:hypothetical protein
MFGGCDMELTWKTPPDVQVLLNDMWLFDQSSGGWIPANAPITTLDGQVVVNPSPTACARCISTADMTNFQSVDLVGETSGTQGAGPGGRWGGVTWTDASGNLWLFGGQGITANNGFGAQIGLLNDIWEWEPGSLAALNTGVHRSQSARHLWHLGHFFRWRSWRPLGRRIRVGQCRKRLDVWRTRL